MVLALRQRGTSTSFLQVLELVFFSSDLEGLRKQFFWGGAHTVPLSRRLGSQKGLSAFHSWLTESMATGKRQGEEDRESEAGEQDRKEKRERKKTAKKATGRGGGVLPALQTARCIMWGK